MQSLRLLVAPDGSQPGKETHATRRRVRRRGRRAEGLALRSRRGRGAGADHRDGPRLLGREGDVPRPVRGGLRRRRPGGAGLRPPQLRRERRRAPPGDRPLGAGARLSPRDHLRLHAARGRCRPHRDLGLQLLGRARAGGGGHRPAGEVRGVPGPPHQRPPQRPAPREGRLRRRGGRDVRRGSRQPLRGRAAGDDPGGGRGPPGALVPADRGLLRLVHRDRRDPGALVAQRGDAAERGDVLGVRARGLHPVGVAHAAPHGGGGQGSPDGVRPGDRGLRAGARAEEAGDPPRAGTSTPTWRRSTTPPAPRADWFTEHLLGG